MFLFGLLFAFWRWLEIITLIPTLGMLAYFVHGFTENNLLTPNYVLVLFITSVLGAVYAIYTLLAYSRTKHSAFFVSFIDLCFVGAFIASVVALRGIASADCTNLATSNTPFYVSLGPFGAYGGQFRSPYGVNVNKNCAMLKASFAFGIMNCIFFWITSILALFLHRRNRDNKKTTVVRRESHHSSRHGARRSGSHHSHRGGSGYYPPSRSGSGRRSGYV
jgi:hypothetical protein